MNIVSAPDRQFPVKAWHKNMKKNNMAHFFCAILFCCLWSFETANPKIHIDFWDYNPNFHMQFSSSR